MVFVTDMLFIYLFIHSFIYNSFYARVGLPMLSFAYFSLISYQVGLFIYWNQLTYLFACLLFIYSLPQQSNVLFIISHPAMLFLFCLLFYVYFLADNRPIDSLVLKIVSRLKLLTFIHEFVL